MSQTINAGIERRGTGRGGYVLALVVALAAFAAMAWLITTKLNEMAERHIQVVVPTDVEITLDEPGTYTIFNETNVVIGGRLYGASSISGLTVSVSSPRRTPVAVRTPTTTSTYNVNAREGRSVFEFTIEEPGIYRFVAGYPDGRKEPVAVLAVTRGFVGALLTMIFGALAIVVAGIALAAFIAMRTLARRRGDRRPQHSPYAKEDAP